MQPAFSFSDEFVAKRLGADSDATSHLPSQQLGWKMLLKSRKGVFRNGESGRKRRGRGGSESEGEMKAKEEE